MGMFGAESEDGNWNVKMDGACGVEQQLMSALMNDEWSGIVVGWLWANCMGIRCVDLRLLERKWMGICMVDQKKFH